MKYLGKIISLSLPPWSILFLLVEGRESYCLVSSKAWNLSFSPFSAFPSPFWSCLTSLIPHVSYVTVDGRKWPILTAVPALALCSPSAEAPFPVPSCADRTGSCHLDRGARYHSGTLCRGPFGAHPHHLHRPLFGAEARSGDACAGAYSAVQTSGCSPRGLRVLRISVVCESYLLCTRSAEPHSVSDTLLGSRIQRGMRQGFAFDDLMV